MNKPPLTLVCGIVASGKSTLAKLLASTYGWDHFEADQHFHRDGTYKFHASELHRAHAECFQKTQSALLRGRGVVVANTFTRQWEREPYLSLKSIADVKVIVVSRVPFDADLFQQQNDHGVDRSVIKAMHERFEHDPFSPAARASAA